MNKLFLVCLLLPVVAEYVSAVDLCTELKCGTDQSSDACASLTCPAPPNLTETATNGTTPADQTTDTSKGTAPSNFGWQPYPADVPFQSYPWEYPVMSDEVPFPFQGGFQGDFQGAYPPSFAPFGAFQAFQPFQYPFY